MARMNRNQQKAMWAKKYQKTWIMTNPKTMESYRFGRKKNGIIETVEFLGYRSSKGKLYKP